MSETATKTPITDIMPILATIGARSWEQFKSVEINFAAHYVVEVWEDVFNFHLLPALYKKSNKWLLIQNYSVKH